MNERDAILKEKLVVLVGCCGCCFFVGLIVSVSLAFWWVVVLLG